MPVTVCGSCSRNPSCGSAESPYIWFFLVLFCFSTNPESNGSASLLGLPFFILGTMMFLLGFADDLFGLPASLRLLAQVGIGVAAYLSDMRIDNLTHPFEGGPIEMGDWIDPHHRLVRRDSEFNQSC